MSDFGTKIGHLNSRYYTVNYIEEVGFKCPISTSDIVIIRSGWVSNDAPI